MKANILNIHRFSLQNGPGSRTVIFFKGCPLRCLWCSNPESQSRPTELLWDRKKCFYGHLCEIHCPTKSVSFENDIIHFNPDTCINCGSCILQCPSKALEFAGKIMDLQEIMDEILKDQEVYIKSGGGVTLSGGEVLSQSEFAYELLKKCREYGIHTVVETSGYSSPLVFSKLARQADLLLFDIKHYDNKEHIKYIGVSQGKILENLDSAVSMKIPVIVRIPVIPGVTGALTDARGFAQLLREHGVTSVKLLPFYQSGDKKYEILNMDYQLKDCETIRNEDLDEYLQIFRQEGLDAST